MLSNGMHSHCRLTGVCCDMLVRLEQIASQKGTVMPVQGFEAKLGINLVLIKCHL